MSVGPTTQPPQTGPGSAKAACSLLRSAFMAVYSSRERSSWDERDLDALRRWPAREFERGLNVSDADGVRQIGGQQIRMGPGELVGECEHPSPVKRYTRFQCQVVAQHRAHADRV